MKHFNERCTCRLI